MSAIYLYPVIIVAGILQAAGAAMSAQLKTSLANPWLASTVSFGLIVCVFILLFAVMPRPLPTAQGIAGMPWWAPLAGLAGALAVLMGLLYVDKIGAGPFNGLVITANILASLAIDHFGLLNMQVHEMSIWRALGAVLMVGGIVLISIF